MKRNVRVFGFLRRHWFLLIGILLLLMLPTTTEAQRFSNRRPMGRLSQNVPRRRTSVPRTNAQNSFTERQKMMQDLERKLQRQQELANEIARHREELRRLRNSGPNVGFHTKGRPSVVQTVEANNMPKGRASQSDIQTQRRRSDPGGKSVRRNSRISLNKNTNSFQRGTGNRWQQWRRVSKGFISGSSKPKVNTQTRVVSNAKLSIPSPKTRAPSSFIRQTIKQSPGGNRRNSTINSADTTRTFNQRQNHRTAVPFRNNPGFSMKANTAPRISQGIQRIHRNTMPYKANGNNNQLNTRNSASGLPFKGKSDVERGLQNNRNNNGDRMYNHRNNLFDKMKTFTNLNRNTDNSLNTQSSKQTSVINSVPIKTDQYLSRNSNSPSETNNNHSPNIFVRPHSFHNSKAKPSHVQHRTSIQRKNKIGLNNDRNVDNRQIDVDNKAIFLRYQGGTLQARDQHFVKVQSRTSHRQATPGSLTSGGDTNVGRLTPHNFRNGQTQLQISNDIPLASVENKFGAVSSKVDSINVKQNPNVHGSNQLMQIKHPDTPQLFHPVDTLSQDLNTLPAASSDNHAISVKTSHASAVPIYSPNADANTVQQSAVPRQSSAAQLPVVVQQPQVSQHGIHQPAAPVPIQKYQTSQNFAKSPPVVQTVGAYPLPNTQIFSRSSQNVAQTLPGVQTVMAVSPQNPQTLSGISHNLAQPKPAVQTVGNIPQTNPQIVSSSSQNIAQSLHVVETIGNIHTQPLPSSQNLAQSLPNVQTVEANRPPTLQSSHPSIAQPLPGVKTGGPSSAQNPQVLTKPLPAVQTLGNTPFLSNNLSPTPITAPVANIPSLNQFPNYSPMASYWQQMSSGLGANFGMMQPGMSLRGIWDGSSANVPPEFSALGITHGSQLSPYWQNMMFGDSIDPPDPPDPVSNATTPVNGVVEMEPVILTTTTFEPPATVKPPKKVIHTTTVATPKPTTPNIIHSIAMQLANLLGKKNGLKLGNVSPEKPEPIVKPITQSGSIPAKVQKPLKEEVGVTDETKVNVVSKAEELPVLFLSGKAPKVRDPSQTIIDIGAAAIINTKVDPVLAGVKVDSIKAQKLAKKELVPKEVKANINSWKKPPNQNVVQAVVNVQSQPLNPMDLFPKDLLAKAVIANLKKPEYKVKKAPKVLVQSPISSNKMINVMHNPVSFIDSLLVNETPAPPPTTTTKTTTTTTTKAPVIVVAAEPAAVIDQTIQENKPQQQDQTSIIKSALVDILSKIKHMWAGSNSSLVEALLPVTTTTTEIPCTPDLPTYKCLGIGVFEGVPSVGAWCVDKCRKNACVESVCKCSCSLPAPGVAGWQGTTTESSLGTNDRLHTTDVPEEIEPSSDKRPPEKQRRKGRRRKPKRRKVMKRVRRRTTPRTITSTAELPEEEDMVTIPTTTEATTTEAIPTTTYSYYDVTTGLYYDVSTEPSIFYDVTTEQQKYLYKEKFKATDIHWGSDTKPWIRENPNKDNVGATSGYDVLGVNPDTLRQDKHVFMTDIERTRWGRRHAKSKKKQPQDKGWSRRERFSRERIVRDPRPGNWHDPSPRDRWNDRGPPADRGRDRHYDPWTEAPSPSPSPSEAPWRRRDTWREPRWRGGSHDTWREPAGGSRHDRKRIANWRDPPTTREVGTPDTWSSRDHWGSRDRYSGGRRRSGLRDRWRETTTKANEEQEGPEAPDK